MRIRSMRDAEKDADDERNERNQANERESVCVRRIKMLIHVCV